jgi:hypothetical protein
MFRANQIAVVERLEAALPCLGARKESEQP